MGTSTQTGQVKNRRSAYRTSCYNLNEFNSGCNERQRLEGEKGIITKLVKRKEYRSITTLLILLGLPRVTKYRTG